MQLEALDIRAWRRRKRGEVLADGVVIASVERIASLRELRLVSLELLLQLRRRRSSRLALEIMQAPRLVARELLPAVPELVELGPFVQRQRIRCGYA